MRESLSLPLRKKMVLVGEWPMLILSFVLNFASIFGASELAGHVAGKPFATLRLSRDFTAIAPSWQPPGWLYGLAWTAVASLLSVGQFLVWRTGLDVNNTYQAFMWLSAILPLLFVVWHVAHYGYRAIILGTIILALALGASVANVVLSAYYDWGAFVCLIIAAAWVLIAFALAVHTAVNESARLRHPVRMQPYVSMPGGVSRPLGARVK